MNAFPITFAFAFAFEGINNGNLTDQLTSLTAVAPEPAAASLMGLALLALVWAGRRRGRAVVLTFFLSTLWSLDASAATFFSSRTDFEAQFPGLPLEDFAVTPPLSSALFTGPVNSALNSTVYMPGDILPGVTISDGASNSFGYGHVFDLGVNSADQFLFTDQHVTKMIIDFLPGVNAAGMNLHTTNGIPENVTIDVFDTMGGALDSTLVASSAAGQFFGVFSAVAIGRISLEATTMSLSSPSREIIDNLSFGQASAPEPAAALLLAVGLVALRFRR